jgi:hypothetical protein
MYHAAWGTQPLRGWLTVRKGLGEESVAAMRRSAAVRARRCSGHPVNCSSIRSFIAVEMAIADQPRTDSSMCY